MMPLLVSLIDLKDGYCWGEELATGAWTELPQYFLCLPAPPLTSLYRFRALFQVSLPQDLVQI